MNKFVTGTTYYTRSICDYDCIYTMTVVSRTAKTLVADLGHGRVKTLRIKTDGNGMESVKPHGSYSMAAIIEAEDTKVLRPTWDEVTEKAAFATESVLVKTVKPFTVDYSGQA